MKTKRKITFPGLLMNMVLMIGAFTMIASFVVLIICSLKPNQDILKFPYGLVSVNWTLRNYQSVIKKLNLFRAILNSVLLSVAKTAIILYTSALAAYVLEKTQFKGRKVLFMVVLCTMMVPSTVNLVPSYQMMSWFKWLDSYAAIIIPFAFKTYGIFLIKQYLEGVPDYFVDAGRVDGASETTIFHRLILPMMQGGLFPLGVLTAVETWNDFMWPYIVLHSYNKYTLPIALQSLSNQYWNDFSEMLAGVVISIIPLFVVYLVAHDKIIEGLAHSGTTG